MSKKGDVTSEKATMECADNAGKLADAGCTHRHTHTHTRTHPSYQFKMHDVFEAEHLKTLARGTIHFTTKHLVK